MNSEGEGIITVAVEGARTEPQVWQTVRTIPEDQLPALTAAQREVAASLHIPEADYARSVEAGRRGADQLLKKATRFARLLREKIHEMDRTIRVDRVTLDAWGHRFEVILWINGELETLRVSEDLVDNLFEEGSREAEESLARILHYGLFSGQRE